MKYKVFYLKNWDSLDSALSADFFGHKWEVVGANYIEGAKGRSKLTQISLKKSVSRAVDLGFELKEE
jgi:phosphosulfolactate synthase (CoM biosynthesis protein A)